MATRTYEDLLDPGVNHDPYAYIPFNFSPAYRWEEVFLDR